MIATGGMVPHGADAVVMVEHTDTRDQGSTTVIDVRRAVVSGQFIAFAGSDLARGETVLRAGQALTSREIGMLAAVGTAAVAVWRRPRVAIISTGDEIVAPGKPIRPGAVYDSNAFDAHVDLCSDCFGDLVLVEFGGHIQHKGVRGLAGTICLFTQAWF